MILHNVDSLDCKDLLCSVNVQHNCAAHRCNLSGSRSVYLERERQSDAPAVRHLGSTTDLILNTAKIRDAKVIQRFSIPMPLLNTDEVVKIACQVEIAASL